jgi:hypothetical protein
MTLNYGDNLWRQQYQLNHYFLTEKYGEQMKVMAILVQEKLIIEPHK